MINRGVLIVRPKQPFLDWAGGLDDSNLLPDVEGEQTAYLIPEFDGPDDADFVVACNPSKVDAAQTRDSRRRVRGTRSWEHPQDSDGLLELRGEDRGMDPIL